MKKFGLISILAFLGLSSFQLFAAQWQAKHFQYQGFDLPYEIYQPDAGKNQSGNKMPLIIHLHGTGEAGTDNHAQLYTGQHIGPDYFASPEIQAMQPAIVLAPQTPAAMRWASTSLDPYDFQKTPSTPSMTALLKLVDRMIAHNPQVDPERVYMTGLSRGGQGVWNAAMQRPDLFAAIVPIAGSASPKDAGLLTHLPIWAFHGDRDDVTSVAYTRQMVDAIYASGGTSRLLRYTEVEGGAHPDSWKTAFQDTRLYHWMLRHRRHVNRAR